MRSVCHISFSLFITIMLFSCYRQKTSDFVKKADKPILINDQVPEMIRFVADSLKREPVEKSVFQIGIPKNPVVTEEIPGSYTQLPFSARKTKLQATQLKGSPRVLIPGTEGVKLPSDTIILPVIVPLKYPPLLEAGPLRYSENARLNLQYLNEEHNLGSSNVYSIIQDSRGSMWFGTWGAGICRYDGQYISHFTDEHGLKTLAVQYVFEDSKGNIWLGLRRNDPFVVRFDGKSFFYYQLSDSAKDVCTMKITEDNKGNIWFGTEAGAYLYNGESFALFSSAEGLSDMVMDICEDKNGTMWFATWDGIVRWNGKAFIHYTKTNGLSSNNTYAITTDAHNNLWIGTDKGACRFDGRVFETFSAEEILNHNLVKVITTDKKGNVWLGTLGGGLSRYNNDGLLTISMKEGLLSNMIWSIEEDDAGNLWIGSVNGGVNRLRPDGIRHITTADGISSESIYPIVERHNGEIWAATLYDGMLKFNGNSFGKISAREGLPEGTPEAIMEDSNRKLWLGFDDSFLATYNNGQFTRYDTLSCAEVPYYISDIAEDPEKNIWVASLGGLFRYNGSSFIQYTNKGNPLPGTALFCDESGTIWLGEPESGLKQIKGDELVTFTKGSGFPESEITKIYKDSFGNIWFGLFHKGVCRFDDSTFIYISMKDGLHSNFIRDIIEDDNKNIWIGTDKGLNALQPVLNQKGMPVAYQVKSMSRHDGFRGNDFRNFCISHNDELWASTGNGINIIDLSQYAFSSDTPRLYLQGLLINQQFIDFSRMSDTAYQRLMPLAKKLKKEADEVPAFFNFPTGLKLPYRLNHLTFKLTAIDWATPHKLKYRYKISGVDEDWSALTVNAVADYRNIPPGRHVFSAQAIGEAGIWSHEFRFAFSVRPPWWFAWWAYVGYGVVLVFSFLRYRKYLLKRAQEKSDLRIKEMEVGKMKELDEHKSRFFANISHEFRTPLSLILSSVDDLANLNFREENIARPLHVMQRNGKRLSRLVNQLLELSKLDEGYMRLHLTKGNISEALKYIVASYDSIAQRKRIKLCFRELENPPVIYWDQEKLEMIVHNLLSNAFKYTPEYGRIDISISLLEVNDKPTACRFQGRCLYLEISDTGQGIPEEKLKRLFVRFEKVSNDHKQYREGMGIGLALTRELVGFQRGLIDVESVVDKGSVFRVYLPCDETGFEDIPKEDQPPGVLHERFEVAQEPWVQWPGMPDAGNESNEPLSSKIAKTLLVVEDNHDMQQYLQLKLTPSYQVNLAPNGNAAWEKVLKLMPDLVVTDLMMPEMDGLELCRLVKSDQRTSHIPLIMLTAKATVESRITGFNTGADDYLEKPFHTGELLARIRNLLLQREKLKEKYISLMGVDSDTIRVSGMDEQFLKKALSEVEKNMNNPSWSVESFSEAMHMSHSQLFRKLKALTEMSVTDFIQTVRLKKAASLLEKNAGTVTEIAFQAGFNDASYFTKCFKKQYKVSPRSYALRYKNK